MDSIFESSGIENSSKPQLLKQLSGIDAIFLDNVIEFRELHPLKADRPSCVILSKRITLSSIAQPLKQLSGIDVIPLSKEIF